MKRIFTLLSALMISGIGFSQTYVQEDFSTFTMPVQPPLASGWKNVDSLNFPFSDSIWRFDNPGNHAITPPMSGNFAIVDSDFYGPNSTQDCYLSTPNFDASQATVVLLEFDHFFQAIGGSFGEVQVFDGVAWVSDTIYGATTANPAHELIDISLLAAGVSNAQVRFRYSGNYGWQWAIDNVNIYTPLPDDAAVVAVNDIVFTDCSLPRTEAITAVVTNAGSTVIDNFPIGYTINGGTVVADIVTDTLQPGDTVLFTFATNATFNTAGQYNIDVFTSLRGDANLANDTSDTQTSILIQSAPYNESFDSFTPGAGFDNAGSVLGNGWIADPDGATPAYFWGARNTPTGSGGTGPDFDHTSGTGNFLYVEGSNGNVGDVALLTSPCVDLGGLTAPRLEFWYHKFGTTDMRDMIIDIYDGTNWIPGVDSINGVTHTSNTDPWLLKTVDLTAYAGNTIQVRFRSGAKVGFSTDMAIDDLRIYQPSATDLGVNAILSPATNCGLGAADSVCVTIVNYGTAAVSNFQVGYTFNGNTITETYSSSINVGDTVRYCFNATVNVSVPGTYTIDAFTNASGDGDITNDSSSTTFDNIPVIASFPYTEDFESGNGGWISDGVNNSWALGTPAASVINSAANGLNSYTTNLTGFYNAGEESFVVGPCFDFTNLNAPQIKMNVWWNSENSWDGAVLESSIDGGNTWQQVGAFGDPNNWYTDNTINGLQNAGLSGEGWTGRNSSNNGSGGWVLAEHDLTGLGNISGVILRVFFAADGSVHDEGFAFDDILIQDAPAADAGITEVVSPVTNCGLSAADSVCVLVANLGSAPISNFPVSYVFNGNTVTETITSTINPGDTLRFCFNATVNVSTPATYMIQTYTALPSDGNLLNDTLSNTFDNIPIVSGYPYTQDFESGTGGWVSGGINNSWAIGTPAASVINSAANGLNSYATNLTGLYNSGEQSFVVGPCFDFTSLNAPQIKMNVWWNSEFSWDGAVLESSVDGGATWQQVGAFGDPNNWYTDNTINGLQNAGLSGEGWTGRNSSSNGSGGWVLAEHDLTGLANSPAVILRIFFGADGSVQDEGFAFDDILIQDAPANDAGIAEVVSPVTNCGLSAADSVCVLVVNAGSAPISNFPVNYVFNGNTITETITSTVNPGDTLRYCFNATVNVSTPATYSIQTYTSLAGDGNLLNDTLSNTFDNIPIISGYPYTQDFESGTGGWVSGGINNSWMRGTPAASIINSAANGLNSYVTNLSGLYNANEQSFVVGPCFDFTSLNAPQIKMNVWWNTEFSWDGAVLESSVDGGATWQQVGAFGDPNNWYTDNTINGLQNAGLSGEGWTGRNSTNNGSGGWVLAEHDLTGLANSPAVILRIFFAADGSGQDEGFAFDDILIQDAPANDVGAVGIVAPLSSCNLSAADSVKVAIANFGSAPASNFPVSFEFNGGAAVTETVTATLNPGDTITYTFTTATVNVSSPGTTYGIVAYTALAMDGNLLNDTLVSSVSNDLQILPYTENFDSFTPGTGFDNTGSVLGNGWVATPDGSNTEFFWGARNTATGSGGTGPDFDNTTGTSGLGNFIYVEGSNGLNGDIAELVSPCVDLGSAVTPRVDFWYHKFGNNMGDMIIDLYDGTQWVNGIDTIFGQTQTATTDPYLFRSIDISSYSGNTIQIRFRSTAKTGFATDMAIDDFVVVDQPVSVNNINDDEKLGFAILPNPSSGLFTLVAPEANSAINIEIIDTKGQLVYSEIISANSSRRKDFDLSNNAKGIYFVKISDGDSSKVEKLVIK